MRPKPRPAVWSLLLVLAVTLGVFASTSFAIPAGPAASGDLLTDDVARFESLRTSGSVKAFDDHGEKVFRMSFRATLEMRQADLADQPLDEHQMPDVVIHQSIRYPLLSQGDRVDFVGPVGLPFESEELAVTIALAGPCFEDGTFDWAPAGQNDVRCVDSKLVLGDEAFDVTDLLREVEGRVWFTGRHHDTVKMMLRAEFVDPGYPFPITSLGEGSDVTVLFGPFGGSTEVRRVNFSG